MEERVKQEKRKKRKKQKKNHDFEKETTEGNIDYIYLDREQWLVIGFELDTKLNISKVD